MHKIIKNIYLSSPCLLKNIFVSAYGVKIYRERYGPRSRFYENFLFNTQQLDEKQTIKLQENAFIKMARSAISNVPFYRDWALINGIKVSDIVSVDSLNLFPVLDKETVRKNPECFVSNEYNIRKLIVHSTSGSTGEPVKIYVDADSRTFHYAFFTRLRKWYGVEKNARRVTFLGRVIIKSSTSSPPFWVYDATQRNLIMSSFHISNDNLIHYYRKIKKFRPKEVFGYASSIYGVARFINEKGLEPIETLLVMPTAETLMPYQREEVKRAFKGKLINQYGCTEMAFFGSENNQSKMLMHPEHAITEVIDEKGVISKVGEGEILATSLVNRAMPLIRYRVGDRIIKSDSADPGYPGFEVLESLEGRVDDVIYTKDGRSIGRMSPIFRSDKCIAGSQVVQEKDGTVNIYVVPDFGYGGFHRDLIRSEVVERIGHSVSVNIIEVEKIRNEPNGKFRPVKSFFKPV